MKVMKKCLWLVILVVVLGVLFVAPSQALKEKDGVVDRSVKQEYYKSVLAELQAEIDANGYTFTVGYNPAVQYSIEELCTLNTTLPLSTQYKIQPFDKGHSVSSVTALPASYLGYYTSIKNQGSCGSCWAFGAVGLLESMVLKATGTEVDLSEQYMLSCNPYGWGCDGGFWPNDMLVNPGSALESCFPYVASEVPCNSACATPYKIQGWGFVTEDYVVPATDLIKQAIYTYGAVQAGVYVDRSFQYYTSGVLNKCAKNPRYTNHAIILVGWDDALGSWRLKNSWGTGWGEQGFMWIKYGCDRVGEGANYFVY